MHWTQALFIGLLGLAIITGRPSRVIAAVMVGNLVATMVLASSQLAVGLADLISAVCLIGISRRANIIAGLFAAMVPVYVIGDYCQWTAQTTYTIIDLIAFLQLGAIGRGDVGIGIVFRNVGRRGIGLGNRVFFGNQAARGMARNPESNGGKSG